MPIAQVSINAFGPLSVDDGGGVVALRGKPAVLLALLACFPGQAIGRAMLAEALWDSAALPPDTDRAVRQVQRRLAELVPAVPVTATATGLRLDATAVTVDVAVCTELLRSAEPDRMRRGLAMWTTDPFPELTHVPAAQVALDELGSARLGAVESLIELRLTRAGYPLVAELERLVSLHPHRERLWRQLAVALHRCDRRVDALRALERYRAVNAAPSAELLRLERALVLDQLDRAG